MIHSFCSAENTWHEDFGLSVYDVFVHVHTPATRTHKKDRRFVLELYLCGGNDSEGQHHFDTYVMQAAASTFST